MPKNKKKIEACKHPQPKIASSIERQSSSEIESCKDLRPKIATMVEIEACEDLLPRIQRWRSMMRFPTIAQIAMVRDGKQ